MVVAVEAQGQHDGAGRECNALSCTFLTDLRTEGDNRVINTEAPNEQRDSDSEVVLQILVGADRFLQLGNIDVDRLILAGFKLRVDEGREQEIGKSVKEVTMVYVAGRLSEDRRVEQVLSENAIDYAVDFELFQNRVLGILPVEREGVGFYAFSGQAAFCRRVLREGLTFTQVLYCWTRDAPATQARSP